MRVQAREIYKRGGASEKGIIVLQEVEQIEPVSSLNEKRCKRRRPRRPSQGLVQRRERSDRLSQECVTRAVVRMLVLQSGAWGKQP